MSYIPSFTPQASISLVFIAVHLETEAIFALPSLLSGFCYHCDPVVLLEIIDDLMPNVTTFLCLSPPFHSSFSTSLLLFLTVSYSYLFAAAEPYISSVNSRPVCKGLNPERGRTQTFRHKGSLGDSSGTLWDWDFSSASGHRAEY